VNSAPSLCTRSNHIVYWQERLKRLELGDPKSFGQFGENFTIEGLPDDAVCIGDRYRIGSALFEVTQPRVTCYRISVPNSSASPALSSDPRLRRMARASSGAKLPILEPMYIASVVPLNRSSFGG
jgi:hypothetical protein